ERYLRLAIGWHRERADPAGVALASASLASTLLMTERREVAMQVLEEAAADPPDADSEAGIALAAELARAYMLSNRATEALGWSERALIPAERLGLVPSIVDVLVSKADALSEVGRTREAIALLTGALRLAEEHDLARPRLRALNNLAGQLLLDDPATAVR